MILTAAFAAAVAVFVGLTIRPRRLSLDAPTDGAIAGVLHVHTSRSDGSSTPDEIAAAAARAGLQFIVLTDHGDGTRTPDPPVYRSGVLCLDGVEVSTTGGHYIALDMPPAPYPLGGEARDVVDDVRRLGGFGVVAHPDSPKPELQWREWDAPFDAVEMLNPDTGWRVLAAQPGWRPRLWLFAALVDYPFRPPETIAGLLADDTGLSARWAALAARRRIVTIAGADAHARLAPRSADPGDAALALPLPGYESSFRVLSVRVRPERPLSGDAASDAQSVMRALRGGHLHTVVDGMATPGSLEFTAAHPGGLAHEGDELNPRGPVTLRVRTNAPPPFTASIWNGSALVSGGHHEPEFEVAAPSAPAVFWVDVRPSSGPASLPWMRSNAIYVRQPGGAAAAAPPAPITAARPIFDGATADGWTVEHDPGSVAATDFVAGVSGHELQLRFGLSNQPSPPPFVALSYATPGGVAPFSRLAVTVRAAQPMRVSVQLRTAGQGEWSRWRRSMFIDVSPQERVLALDDFRPVNAAQPAAAPLEAVRSVMFVVDPVNTKRGTSGRLWIAGAAFQN